MEGEATVRARPDAVQLRAGVTAQAETPTGASSENAQRMNAVLDAGMLRVQWRFDPDHTGRMLSKVA